MRGRMVPLSPGRRMLEMFTLAADDTTKGVIKRRMALGRLIDALGAAPAPRPLWSAAFAKAWGRVAAEQPEFRRLYVRLPWVHLYEVPVSVASIIMEREVGGETALFLARIKDPMNRSVRDMSATLRHLKTAPVTEIKDFAVALRTAALPRPLRRLAWWIAQNFGRQRPNFLGTFGITLLAGEGVEITSAVSPWTSLLTCGLADADGHVDVTCVFDHRVMDGRVVAVALRRLEEVLTGEIAAEIASDPLANGPGTR